jgi:hypothetical protein
MNRWVVVAAVVLLLWVVSAAHTTNAESTALTAWDVETPLTWDLFQGTPPSNADQLSEIAAIHMTVKWHVTYAIQPRYSGATRWLGAVDSVIVANLMNPRFSWVVLTRATPEVLRHEQGHFDLNEVYRRKLEVHLSCIEVGGSTAEQTRAVLDRRVHETGELLLGQLSLMQSRYDEQTRHGTDRAAQARWEEDLSGWLANPLTAP